MPRPENPILADDAVARFALALRELRRAKGLGYREMGVKAKYSSTILSQAAAGKSLPNWNVVSAFVQACDDIPEDWRPRWESAVEQDETATREAFQCPANFQILGAVRAERGGREARIASPACASFLAILLDQLNQTVSTSSLIDAIWDHSDFYDSHSLYKLASWFRKELGPGLLETNSYGYRLIASASQVDLGRFNLALHEARNQASQGNIHAAERSYAQALREWSDEPLTNVTGSYAESLRQRLIGEYRAAKSENLIVQLEIGHASSVIDLARQLANDNPYDEKIIHTLMLALYRTNRVAEALDVYRQTRNSLVEVLGIEPSPSLNQLQMNILRHSPILDAQFPRPPGESDFSPEV